jgi:uncharacterized protein YkwD
MRIALLSTLLLVTGCATLPAQGPKGPLQPGQPWVDAHNAFRRAHGAPPVRWSEELARSAQAVAESCPSGHSKTPYGENIAWVSVRKPPQTIVKYWYDEEPQYDYANPGYSFSTGHFTQLVWHDTTEIGCGQATGCKTRIANIWVCHYNPAGNYSGQFGDQVGRKRGP